MRPSLSWHAYLRFAARRSWRLAVQRRAVCWICGARANSAEHRFKKSDLVRVYGRGTYSHATVPARVSGAVVRVGQSPDAAIFKYAQSLCHECNTARTQPFDLAYERFVAWVATNQTQVLRRRWIDLEDVYGAGFAADQRNLFRYFTKSLGCRLADAGAPIPADLIAILFRDRFFTGLRLTFAVDEKLIELLSSSADDFLGKGALFATFERKRQGGVQQYFWNEHIGWLVIHYWYNAVPDGSTGATWVADAKYLYLGAIDQEMPGQAPSEMLSR